VKPADDSARDSAKDSGDDFKGRERQPYGVTGTSGSTGAPSLCTAKGRQQLLTCYRDGLLNDTLPFWFPRCLDVEYGGYLHCLDRDGSLLDSDKSVWAQGRMSWLLLALHNSWGERVGGAEQDKWLTWGRSGLEFLERHGFDHDGRMFFHVTRDGRPIRKRRYAFSESFAAIAYAADYRATGEARSAEQARRLFELFTDWNFTAGLMPAKFTDTRPMIGLAPRMIAIVTAQELRDDLGEDPCWTRWIDRCIGEIRELFVKPELRVVMESVAPDGSIVDHFDGRLLNPGHAIEGAWFILREGAYRNDQSLIQLGCDMLDWMWERGWDDELGGLFYFRDLYGKPVQEYWHDMKFWWPHNETILATLLAYELTGEFKYARWHQQVHDWSYCHFADAQYGEWYGYLHRDGRPSTLTKGNLWKSCFHFPRMQWLCARWLERAPLPPQRADRL
jgi:N-acylglucosamine 2-epimerase